MICSCEILDQAVGYSINSIASNVKQRQNEATVFGVILVLDPGGNLSLISSEGEARTRERYRRLSRRVRMEDWNANGS